jgi:photosystem II stability/assembly factor-like uncharacterized protein
LNRFHYRKRTLSINRAYFLLLFVLLVGCGPTDRGKWELVQSSGLSHAANVGPLLFADNGDGWALTWASLLKVRDKGRTWVPVLSNDNGRRAFYSFTFTTPKIGVVVGTQKKDQDNEVLILQSVDGGESWHERLPTPSLQRHRNMTPSLFSVSFCDEKTGWAVGNDLILHTLDGGESWETQQVEVNNERLFSVACGSSTRAWAVGTGGLFVRTTNGGMTWTRQAIGTNDILMQVKFFGGNGWIVGGTNGNPVLFRSRDAGESWRPQHVAASVGLFDIFFIGDHGWIAAERGTILNTTNGGEVWIVEKTPTNENLTSLFFLTPTEGWVGGDRLTLLHFSG